MKCKSMFSDREIIISLIVVVASTLNAFQIIRIKTFSVLEYISSHIVAIKMGKGNGNGEGWGEGEDQANQPKWKNGLCGSCKTSGGCKYNQ